jgi:protocatechuate 3,4-dioxygenase beta subunit
MRPGSYAINFRDCGAAGQYLSQWYGDSVLPDDAARVQVSAGMPATLKPVTMEPLGGMRTLNRAAARRAASRVGPAASGSSISGVVRSPAGKGLAGVCVQAFTSTANSVSGVGTLSGAGGRYRLPVTRGKWEVDFANGCGGKYAPQWWKHVGSQAKATLLTVRRGSHVTGIDAKLVIGGVITGTVRGSTKAGPGIRGVCVVADGRGNAFGIEQQARTGKNGNYRITGLGTGHYRVQFDPECAAGGKYVGRTFKRLVGVTDGKTTSRINTFLARAAEISGTVTAAKGGAPVGGICVLALPVFTGQGVHEFANVSISNPQGGYTVTGLPTGKYAVNFSGGCGNKGSYAPQNYNNEAAPAAADTVTLATGQHATGINAAMQPGGTITGTVTNQAGAPLRNMCVFATSASDAGGFGNGLEGLLSVNAGPPFSSGAATGRNGHYRLVNLVPGSYEVSFASGCGFKLGAVVYASQWFAPQGGNQPDWLTVRPGVVASGISASLRRGASIAGVIKDPAGKPARGICAGALPLSGQPSEVLLVAGGAGSASDGSYQIRGLAAGRYAVVFGPCAGQPYAITWFNGATSSAAAKPVAVRDGHVTVGINARMSGGQAVTGTVRSAAPGSPVKSVCVVALDSGGLAVEFGRTGSKGGFAFRHVPSGRYTLEYFPCGPGGTSLASVTKQVQVKGAPVAGAGVTLPASGAVSGTVSDHAAAPVAGVCVEATPKAGRGAPGLAVTDGQGQYRMTGLAAGTYTVLFTPECAAGLGGFQQQWFKGQQSASLATPVGVGAGGTHAAVDANLTADGGITGTVQVSGSPASGVCVIAYPASGTRRPALAETAAKGNFVISGLAPGSYDVEFKSGCGASSYTTQWYDGVGSRGAATPVVVTAGTVTQAIDAH